MVLLSVSFLDPQTLGGWKNPRNPELGGTMMILVIFGQKVKDNTKQQKIFPLKIPQIFKLDPVARSRVAGRKVSKIIL